MSNMVVNTNVMALNAHRAMKGVSAAQSQASARLSSGMRINSAADDSAGLAISEKMRGQIRGLDMASKNAQDGVSLIQTAEGGMTEIGNMVQRVRELVVQAANDTNDFATNDRQKIQNEISQLMGEIDSMSERVEFNGKKLINGDYAVPTGSGAGSAGSTALHLQVGANSGQSISVNIGSMDTKSLGLSGLNVNISSGADISKLISTVNSAVNKVADQRASLGAVQNRLEYTIKSLDISSENLTASESRIRDADMAKEMMSLTKTNVLQQAAMSMLTQANQAPQQVLQLLR